MSNYLGANIPEKEKQAQKQTSGRDNDSFKQLEDELAAIKEQLTIQNRDNLDAMYNIGMDNLDDSMKRLISETGNSIASIIVKTNENSASITAFAKWKNGTGTDSLAGFVANATKDFATISMLSQYTTTDEVNGLISNAKAGIISEAQEGMATVSMIASVTDNQGDITAASIIAAVNKDNDSSVKIKADKVDITGFVTFSDLSTSGATTINGNNISLQSDEDYGPLSKIRFTKYSSYDGEYKGLASLSTRDFGPSENGQARYAFCITTYATRVNGTFYDTALRLDAEGSIAIESVEGKIFARCPDDVQIMSTRGIIRLNPAYYSGDVSLNSGEYSFCADGIYYGSIKIVDNTKAV